MKAELDIEIYGDSEDPVSRFQICIWLEENGDPLRVDLERLLEEAVRNLEEEEPRAFRAMLGRITAASREREERMKKPVEDKPSWTVSVTAPAVTHDLSTPPRTMKFPRREMTIEIRWAYLSPADRARIRSFLLEQAEAFAPEPVEDSPPPSVTLSGTFEEEVEQWDL